MPHGLQWNWFFPGAQFSRKTHGPVENQFSAYLPGFLFKKTPTRQSPAPNPAAQRRWGFGISPEKRFAVHLDLCTYVLQPSFAGSRKSYPRVRAGEPVRIGKGKSNDQAEAFHYYNVTRSLQRAVRVNDSFDDSNDAGVIQRRIWGRRKNSLRRRERSARDRLVVHGRRADRQSLQRQENGFLFRARSQRGDGAYEL